MLGEGGDLVPVSMVQGEFQCSVLSLRVRNLIDANDHGVVSCEPSKNDPLLRDILVE